MWNARIRSLLALREGDDASPASLFDDADEFDASDVEALTHFGDTIDLFVAPQ
jgi:hypothetical protein